MKFSGTGLFHYETFCRANSSGLSVKNENHMLWNKIAWRTTADEAECRPRSSIPVSFAFGQLSLCACHLLTKTLIQKKLRVIEKHVSGSRTQRLAASCETYSLSVRILWLLPSATRCARRRGGEKLKQKIQEWKSQMYHLNFNCSYKVGGNVPNPPVLLCPDQTTQHHAPTDLSAIPTSLEVQRQKPQAR